MPKNPYDYTVRDAETFLSPLRTDLARRALLYHAGDHFQRRTEWRGPVPKGTRAEELWGEIERGFVSKNVVREGEERHNYGVLGRESMWSHDPKRQKRKRAGTPSESLGDELDELLVPWWDRRRLLLKFRRATTNALVTGCGCLRLYIAPRGRGVDALERALDRVHFTVPKPGQAVVYTDPVTQESLAVYEYETRTGEKLVEYSFLREDGKTVIRTVAGTDSASILERAKDALSKLFGVPREQVKSEITIDLGGHLHVYEMRRDPLVTEQVLQNQAVLNLALTMLPRNVVMGGFLEAVYKNASKPTVRKLKAGSTTEYEEVEADDIEAGAGVRTFLVGLPRYDADGNVIGVENVDVEWRNPIPVDTFEDTAAVGERNVLSEMHQKHVLEIGDNADEKGAEARKVARDDHEKALLTTKGEIDPMGRWVLDVAKYAMAFFSGEGQQFLTLRPSFDSRTDIGPLNSEDKRFMQQDVNEGRMSRQTYMNRVGIDDPDAELTLIAADTALKTWKERLEVVTMAQKLGFDLDRVLELSGMADAGERQKLIGTGAPPPMPPPALPAANGDAEGLAN